MGGTVGPASDSLAILCPTCRDGAGRYTAGRRPWRGYLLAVRGAAKFLCLLALALPGSACGHKQSPADVKCADYSAADDQDVSRRVAALEVSIAIDAQNRPGDTHVTPISSVQDRLTDEQVSAGSRLAEQACALHPHGTVVAAVLTAVGLREVAIPTPLTTPPPR